MKSKVLAEVMRKYASGGDVAGVLRRYASGGDVGAFGTATPQEEGEREPSIISKLINAVAGSAATLPQRAFESSENMRQGGDYDPAPIVEAAMLPMGTGAVAGVPMRAGEAVLGAGAVRRTALPMDEASRMARAAEQGFEGDWYHGGQRMDRFTESGKIDPRRATSGPMPYFTDSPEMASGYAMGKKADTSLVDEGHVPDYFTISPKDLGWSGRSPITVEKSWHFLPSETKQDILAKAKRVGYENPQEATGPYTLHPEGVDATLSSDHFDYLMKTSARGNPLAALREMWHDGGNLVGSEGDLAEIYRLAGYPHRISETTAPWTEARGVVPVKLRMNNPLNTEDQDLMMKTVLPKLEEAFKRDRTRKQEYGADMWDKNTRFTPKEWVEEAKTDYAKGDNSFVWTSIPDKVTAELRKLGFDGILDTGGKMGGQSHKVAIPFGPEQVRSRFAKFDPSKIDSKDLLASILGTSGAGAAVAANSGQERDGFAQGGQVQQALNIANQYASQGDTGMNIPETPASLQAQQEQLLRGLRIAQMYPKGTEEPAPPEGIQRVETPRGAFHYNPSQVSPAAIKRISEAGRENEVLGLGPFNKDDIIRRIQAGEQPLAVVERARDGTEVKAAVGTDRTAPIQLQAFEAGKLPGSSVGVEAVGDVVGGREGRKAGGLVPGQADGGPVHVGPIKSDVAGRTDHIKMTVAPGAYVIAADVVSGLGEGNTDAGNKVLDQYFPPMQAKRPQGGGVPILAAGGERVIPPEQVAQLGGGNLDKGHKLLDKWMVDQRAKLVKTLQKLPGPAKN